MNIPIIKIDNKRVVAIIQARMGSSRLPGKVLLPIDDVPALAFMISRVRRAKYLDEVVVATSKSLENQAIVDLCRQVGIRVFLGSEDDVLDRFVRAAEFSDADYIVRLTGDCPLFDPGLLDTAIAEMGLESDYLGMLTDTFPDGLDIEIITRYALKKTSENASLASEREHVTLYIKNHPEIFHLKDFRSYVGDHGDLRWTLDEFEDYELITCLLKRAKEKFGNCFGYKELISIVEDNPDLLKINAQFARNEGLLKSLKSDRRA